MSDKDRLELVNKLSRTALALVCDNACRSQRVVIETFAQCLLSSWVSSVVVEEEEFRPTKAVARKELQLYLGAGFDSAWQRVMNKEGGEE